MDGIFVIIALYGIVSAVVKWAKKQAAGGANQGAAPDKPWQRMIGDMAKSFEETLSGKPQSRPATVLTPARPSSPKVYREGGGSNSDTGSGSVASAPAMTPKPYDTISEGSSAPMDPLPSWRGSLPGTDSPYVPAVVVPAVQTDAPQNDLVPAGLNLAFNRDSLLQAVVMQEILARPQDRRRRGSRA